MIRTSMKFGVNHSVNPSFKNTIHPTQTSKQKKRARKSFVAPEKAIDLLNTKPIEKEPIESPTFEEMFDEIIEGCEDGSLNVVIEEKFSKLFETTGAFLWIYSPQTKMLFSPTASVTVPSKDCLIAVGFHTRAPLSIGVQRHHPSYNAKYDGQLISPNSPLLMIPIMNRNNDQIAVLVLARKIPFANHEILMSNFFMNKFKIYSSFLFSENNIVNTAQYLDIYGAEKNVTQHLCATLSKYFRCRTCEIWLMKNRENIVTKYDENGISFDVDPSRIGCIALSLQNSITINEINVKDNMYYDEYSDGFQSEPVLIVPYAYKQSRTWAIALRGRIIPPYFDSSDEGKLMNLVPFIVKIMMTAIKPSSHHTHLTERLSALLEIASSLNTTLSVDELFPIVIRKACELLDAERCSLYLVDPIKKELFNAVTIGLNQLTRLPMDQGIAGITATTGQIINIKDAHNDNRFDTSIDEMTGYRTTSVLCMPVFNNQKEIIAVTQLINKCDGSTFNEEDIRLMKGFNTFVGISIDNARLYSTSIELTQQINTIVEMTSQFSTIISLRHTMQWILDKSKNIVNANRSTLYFVDKTNLYLYESMGQKSIYGTDFASEALAKRKDIIFTPEEVSKRMKPMQISSFFGGGVGKSTNENDNFQSIGKPNFASGTKRGSLHTLNAKPENLKKIQVTRSMINIGNIDLGTLKPKTPGSEMPDIKENTIMEEPSEDFIKEVMSGSSKGSAISGIAPTRSATNLRSIASRHSKDGKKKEKGPVGKIPETRSQFIDDSFNRTNTSLGSLDQHRIPVTRSSIGFLNNIGSDSSFKNTSSKASAGTPTSPGIPQTPSVTLSKDEKKSLLASATSINITSLIEQQAPPGLAEKKNTYGIQQSPSVSTMSSFISSNAFNQSFENVSQIGQTRSFTNTPPTAQSSSEESIVCIPLFDNKKEIIAILEYSSSKKVLRGDEQLLQGIGTMAVVSLQNERNAVQVYLDGERQMKAYLSETHLPLDIWDLKCDLSQFDLIDVCFSLFNKYRYCSIFQFSNEKLFRNLIDIRNGYRKIQYFNWKHAVEVARFVAIALSRCTVLFNPNETFSIFLAALCHDIDHDGFMPADHRATAEQMDILYTKTSVLEAHHVDFAINILSSNCMYLFEYTNQTMSKRIWDYFVKLILATDMSINRPPLKVDESDHLSVLSLILKCADLVEVTKDEIDWLFAEEFWRQNDLTTIPWVKFTDGIRDREHFDEFASRADFLSNVCLPLFEKVIKYCPNLEPCIEMIDKHIDRLTVNQQQ